MNLLFLIRLPVNKYAISSFILRFDESNFSAINVQHEPTGSILIADGLINKAKTNQNFSKSSF